MIPAATTSAGRLRRFAVGALLALLLAHCAFVRKAVLNYTTAQLPESQIVYDAPYWGSAAADPVKNRLDLFLPSTTNFPTLVFVHGGEWVSGDRTLKVLGADIYRNIGRYFALHGIGCAVISYRLLPDTSWRAQILDVARAVDWVHQHIGKYRGDPGKLYVSGHSAGAQLAVRIALDPAPLASLGTSTNIIRGVIPISGAGYDLTDPATYAEGKKQNIFEKMFRSDDISLALRRQLSPQRYVTGHAPPFLILYAGKEETALKNGSVTLHERLLSAGVPSQLFDIDRFDHRTIVLSLSQPQQIPTTAMLVFIRSLSARR